MLSPIERDPFAGSAPMAIDMPIYVIYCPGEIYPDNHLTNNPYKILVAEGDYACYCQWQISQVHSKVQ
jgi:hypothetical protein